MWVGWLGAWRSVPGEATEAGPGGLWREGQEIRWVPQEACASSALESSESHLPRCGAPLCPQAQRVEATAGRGVWVGGPWRDPSPKQ